MSDPIVVTGAAGFIGRNVVEALNARGVERILLVDRLETGEKWKNLLGLRFDDLLNPADFLEVIASSSFKASAVVHLGACSSTTERDADFLLENNYRYSRRLCEWALASGARFIAASSAATYGDGSLGYDDDDSVTPRLRPLNMYGYSKHLFDLWALREGHFKSVVALKYFNVFGPGEDHKQDMRSVVNKAFAQIRESGHVQLFKSHRPDYADGQQMRDFIYVKDAVEVTLWFLENRVGGLFNCGSGVARSWLDLAQATFAAMGRSPDIRFVDMPLSLREKYQYFTQARMTKLRAAGYDKPFRSLEEGVADYVRNHLSRSG